MLRIQTLLIQIRIFYFTCIRLFDTDPYHCCFKEVMYLKRYFLYILAWCSLSVGLTAPNQKAYFVKFSLPVNFVVFIRVAYRSRIPDPDPGPGKWYRSGSATLFPGMQRLFSSITTNGVNPFRERFPLAEFKYVPGAGHWVHSQKPKEFLDLLLPFLQWNPRVSSFPIESNRGHRWQLSFDSTLDECRF